MQPGDIEPYYHQYREERRTHKGRHLKLSVVGRKRGTHNLREYVRRAELPVMDMGPNIAKMPPPDRRSHAIHLSVGFTLWRILQYMEPLFPEELSDDVLSFIATYMPAEPVIIPEPDYITGEWLSVPCKPYQTGTVLLGQGVDNDAVRHWAVQYPLATAQRLLHFAFPETRCWAFQPDTARDPDEEIVSFYTWEARNRQKQVLNTTLAVMIMPPWIAPPADLAAMTKCRKLHRRRFPEDSDPRWKACERLWAKIWDLCTRRGCRWFVITSYNTWAFGAFSPGRTRGFISDPRSFRQREPNVLGTLTYWLASSMDLPGAFTLPNVVELVSEVSQDLEIPPFPYDRFPEPPRSESDWSVNDDVDREVEEAEVSTLLGMAISATSIEEPVPPSLPDATPAQTLMQKVSAWQEHLPRTYDAMSEAAFSAHTVSSAATSMRSDDFEHLYPSRTNDWVTVPLGQSVTKMAAR
ncbi:uncharacterized protein PHACADRAFT_208943 [Phanerochaete carnosa HHB-10118-sp]|uniref:Uncharacterized protein n=1 Tax=Phanerochaete carnosa (strain HHB-10118-sp) TaxID=650164 RepID=K5VV79_PHACS|nr:uncharacterized protein PHACADRAFT_208943 [Phanerochaete carnosa HHB-10118-sp]EKM55423.1 hypothetical protein PHACADRAFT_208943 [Phanerochaete carnosa HHB-10118-sp]